MLIEVWGEWACFTRPEFGAERVSYDVMTPSAARGIVEAIYWHPNVQWTIDRIFVLNPIKKMNIKRNEVSEKISSRSIQAAIRSHKTDLSLNPEACRQQRNTLLLKDVHYIIDAHFTTSVEVDHGINMTGKVMNIFKRRLKQGGCYSEPYFGFKEFTANFQAYEGRISDIQAPFEGIKELGLMHYDRDYRTNTPIMFNAILNNGCLDLRDVQTFRLELQKEVPTCS